MYKIRVLIAVLLISSVVSVFKFSAYILTKQMLVHFKEGINEYDIFFNRASCYPSGIFALQYSFLKNHSLSEESSFYIRFERPLSTCIKKEEEYSLLKF
jgi:hypothetical protein